MFKTKPIFWVYILSILLVFHVGIPLYVNSTFLSSFTSDDIVGLIYSAGSIFTIFCLVAVSKSLEKFGNYKTTLVIMFIELLAVLGLAFTGSLWAVIIAFLGHFAITTVVGLNTDIFLEKYSHDISTGGTRGLLYSLMSVAWLASPIIAGFLVGTSQNYWIVYAASAIFLIPIFVVLTQNFDKFKDSRYHHMVFWKDMKDFFWNEDKRYIALSGFMLKLFFAWMVIYTPIYLNEYMGFDFKQIGFMLTIMMLAYILFEWPVGMIADRKYGEKELLGAGFIVIAITTTFLSFIQEPSILIWTIALFMTRVGAAMVEATTESYFFKKVNSSDTDDISFWRMLRPVGYLVAPLIILPFIEIFGFQYIFLIMGAIMLLGVFFVIPLRDTK